MSSIINKNRKLILVLLLFLLFSATTWLLFVDYFAEPVLEEEVNEKQRDSLLKNARLELYNNNMTREWELFSGTVYMTEDEFMELIPVSINIYDLEKNREIIYSLTAEKGEYFGEERHLYLKGDIILQKEESRITAGSLLWNQKDDTITIAGGFLVENPRFIMQCETLTGDASLQDLIAEGSKEQEVYFRLKEE